MARLQASLIEEIRSKADIVEVIGHYLPLTKKGRSYAAVCPFHDDHDPSLNISAEKQIYKCFVCNAGGNVFTFVQEYEHVSYAEAVAKVAEICHVDVEIELPDKPKAPSPKHQRLHKILNETIAYARYQLSSQDGREALQYLHGRGIDDEVIETFELGYVPKGGTQLYRFLKAKGYPDEDMIDSGICRLSDYGMTDIFVGRILFPIHDPDGNPIGFSARILPNDQSENKPKYINTNQTELYVKSTVLYNAHRARPYCRQQKEVIVVEGPLDVIAMHRAQIHHVVATMGTAFTKEQAGLLRKLAPMAIFSYDGDKAGQNANYKAGLLCKEQHVSFKIVRNTLQLDPDEIIREHGKEELKVMAETPQTWIDFLFTYFSSRYNLKNYSENKEFAAEMMKEISSSCDAFDASVYTERLSQLTGFTASQLSQLKPNLPVIKQKTQSRSNGKAQWSKVEIAERMILSQMMHHTEAVVLFEQELGFLIHENMKYLALFLVSYYRTHETYEFAGMLDELMEQEELRSLMFEIESMEWLDKSWNESSLRDAFRVIIQHEYDEKIKALKLEASKIQDPLKKSEILKACNDLELKKKGALQ